MLSEPDRDVEYTLVRFVDSQLHVATFIRHHDDSGTIRHGQHHIGIEFNWPALLDCWLAMRDVGWQTLSNRLDLWGLQIAFGASRNTFTGCSSIQSKNESVK